MKLYKMIATSSFMLVACVSSFSMMVNVLGKQSTATIPNMVNSKEQQQQKRNIAIVGGTHGNEYTGVWVIKSLQQKSSNVQQRYPNLNVSTLIGNPDAYHANRRFIDTDLNREFSYDKLCEVQDEALDESSSIMLPVEAKRARELNDMLGSKCQDGTDVDGSSTTILDVAIDLHSTTSNMGTTLIINEGDVLMAQGAAYVAQKCVNVHCLMHAIPDKGKRPNLSSTTKHGFTIEVGPVPQGLLRHDAVLKTECALFALLDFLQQYYDHYDGVEQDPLSSPVVKSLQRMYTNGLVPAFRTIPAQQHGEMSGKISWPSDAMNPNFPQWMIHESVQDQDYKLLRKGDPLFVQLDGTVVPYDGAYGDEIYLIFINEGGYYYASSGTGISVALQTQYNINTALFDAIPSSSTTGSNEVMDEL
jgi:succinylglutamate desuccinylase